MRSIHCEHVTFPTFGDTKLIPTFEFYTNGIKQVEKLLMFDNQFSVTFIELKNKKTCITAFVVAENLQQALPRIRVEKCGSDLLCETLSPVPQKIL
jgi:hypothetical protein